MEISHVNSRIEDYSLPKELKMLETVLNFFASFHISMCT